MSTGLKEVLHDILQPAIIPRSLAGDALWVVAKRAQALTPSVQHRRLVKDLLRQSTTSGSIIASMHRTELMMSGKLLLVILWLADSCIQEG